MDESGATRSIPIWGCRLPTNKAIRLLRFRDGYIRGSCKWGRSKFHSSLTWIRQVLSGNVPYWNITLLCAMRAIMGGDRPQKPKAAESIGFTDELWRMVERCWQENRDERPGVREILHCLESTAQAWDTRPPLPYQATGMDRSYSEDHSRLPSSRIHSS